MVRNYRLAAGSSREKKSRAPNRSSLGPRSNEVHLFRARKMWMEAEGVRTLTS